MMTRLALSTALAIVAGTLSPSAFAAVQNGDKCGVTSRDFLNYDYRSDYLVAGEIGCTLGGANANANVNANANEEEEAKEKENNGDDTGCFCAPNLSDGQSLSEWEWQCNGTVRFGPSVGKTCPLTVPVAKGLGILEVVPDRKTRRSRSLQNSNAGMIASVGAESMQQKMGVPCDTSIHPTGRPGDEVCPYSDCDEEGGNHSAICACVDLSKYGMGEGSEWVCMHSTCSCGEDDGIEQDKDASEDESEDESESTEEASEEASEDEASEEDESSEDLSSAATLAVSALASVSMVAMAGLLF